MKEKSCGAVIIDNGKVLLIRQNNGDCGFPKGHVEEGETEQQTAIREVKEETNVDIVIDSDQRYVISYVVKNDIMKDVIYFLAHPINNQQLIAQPEEIDEVMWVDIDKVYDMLKYDDVKKIWQQIKENVL